MISKSIFSGRLVLRVALLSVMLAIFVPYTIPTVSADNKCYEYDGTQNIEVPCGGGGGAVPEMPLVLLPVFFALAGGVIAAGRKSLRA